VVTSLTKVTVGVPPQLSDFTTLVISGAGTNDAQDTVTGGGQVIEGGVWSFTVITCVQVAVLLHASVAM
jgi:hypothetical protein